MVAATITSKRMLPSAHPGRQAGVSLVELMVAITVGLMLIAATTILFASTSHSRQELQKTSRMMENGRYAQDMMIEDLRHAGFYGELAILAADVSVPDPCAIAPADLGWSPVAPLTVPAPVVGIGEGEATPVCVPQRLAGTDIVVVRRVDTVARPVAALPANTTHVQVTRCAEDGPAFAVGRTAAELPLRLADCDVALAAARQYLVRIYYVASCNECGRDQIPTLKRVELVGDEMRVTPLVEGIENMQLDYGFDLDGDGTADRFLPGLSGVVGQADNDWGNLVSVRVNLLVRTPELPAGYVDDRTYTLGLFGAVGPFGDGWKRGVFASTARLNNPAGRRE
jgi:type IV pilus assembly protein PilW